MKKIWQKFSVRIDSRSLRERSIMFGLTAGLIIFLVFSLFLNPTYAKHQQLLGDMASQQLKIDVASAQITQTLVAFTTDPDAADKQRLAIVQASAQSLRDSLGAMQRGMVAPEQMTGLLERILLSHRSLRLKSMRTLGEAIPQLAGNTAPPAAGPTTPAAEQLLHRHGVELVVEGNYSDMVAYMSALENMQGQIFWGSTRLRVDTYPKSTLTLVVYTINLDKKWIKL